MNRTVASSIGLIAACTMGLLLIAYSPAGCSCTDKWEELAYFAGLPVGMSGPQALDASSLQAGLSRKIIGSRATLGIPPFSEREGCLRPRNDLIRCHSVLEESPLLIRGYDIEYRLTGNDTVSDVAVSKFTRLAHAP